MCRGQAWEGAVGAGGHVGVNVRANTEQAAIANALADCGRQDRDCRALVAPESDVFAYDISDGHGGVAAANLDITLDRASIIGNHVGGCQSAQ